MADSSQKCKEKEPPTQLCEPVTLLASLCVERNVNREHVPPHSPLFRPVNLPVEEIAEQFVLDPLIGTL